MQANTKLSRFYLTFSKYSRRVTDWANITDNRLIDEANIRNEDVEIPGGVSLLNKHYRKELAKEQSPDDYFASLNTLSKGEELDFIMGRLENVAEKATDKIVQKEKRAHSNNTRNIAREKKKLLKKYWDKQITIPKGPKMLEREHDNNRETIRQRRNREFLEQKQREEEELIKMNFKARPPPESVLLPRYDAIVQGQEAKSIKNREKKISKTIDQQKPFSFQDREMKRLQEKQNREPELPEDCKTRFVSNNLPEFYTKADELEIKEKQEKEAREKKKEARKKTLLEKAQLPSRMELDKDRLKQREEKIEKLRQELFEKDCKFQPEIKKEVPKFDEQHLLLEKKIIKFKEQNKANATVPEEFEVAKKFKKALNATESVASGSNKVVASEKKKNFSSINNFLERNFAPTEVIKQENLKEQEAKQKEKLSDLKKMTENKNKSISKIANKLTAVKSTIDAFKKKEKPQSVTTMGLFEIIKDEEGTQTGLARKKTPEKPKVTSSS